MIPFCSGNVRLGASRTIHSYVYMRPVRGAFSMKSLFVPMSETQCVTYYVLNDRKCLKTAKNEYIYSGLLSLHSVRKVLYIVMFICAPLGVPNGNLFSFNGNLLWQSYLGSYPCALCRGRLIYGNGARRVGNFWRTVLSVVKNLFSVRSMLHSVRNQLFQCMAIPLVGPGRAGATKWRGCSNLQLEFISYLSSSHAMGNEVPKQAHTALIMENMIYPTGNRVSVAENGFISGSQLFGVFASPKEINIMNICHNEIKWRISLWIFQDLPKVKEVLARLMSYSLLGLWA